MEQNNEVQNQLYKVRIEHHVMSLQSRESFNGLFEYLTLWLLPNIWVSENQDTKTV